MSLLYIASKTAESSETNSMTAHQSKVTSRCVPTAAQEELQHLGCGTKVVVRNLFGNMPVRVKQRALLDECVEDAEWSKLIHAVVAHQLAWKKPVTIRIRDMRGRSVNLRPKTGKEDVYPERAQIVSTMKLGFTLGLLTQASFITADSWGSWVPISAKTSLVKISGAISLDPGPTKQYQFIAMGTRPVLHENQNNELYDEINRLFNGSRFGVIDGTYDEDDKSRRSADRRFRDTGVTNKLLKGSAKGVDRWPMFDLHIDICAPTKYTPDVRTKTAEVAELQSVLKVLAAMVTQWLTEHEFKPRRKGLKTESMAQVHSQSYSSQPAPATAAVAENRNQSETPRNDVKLSLVGDVSKVVTRSSSGSVWGKDNFLPKGNAGEKSDMSSSFFQSWSRIKRSRPGNKAGFTVESKGSTDIVISPQVEQQTSPEQTEIKDSQPIRDAPIVFDESQDQDTWTTWQDPGTRQLFDLNTRSGLLVPLQRPRTAPDMSGRLEVQTSMASRPLTCSSLRLESRLQGCTTRNQYSPWLKTLVEDWDNPVFQPVEQPLEHISLDSIDDHHTGQCLHRHDEGSSSLAQDQPLSRHYLRKASIISQLDNKFILIKMPTGGSKSAEVETSSRDDLLVIMDQHAADERCKVEELLKQLCEGTTTALPLRSNLGHEPRVRTSRLDKPITFETSAAETEMLGNHAGYFAKWGILYDILSSQNATNASKIIQNSKIVIQTLPPVIIERCTAEPRLIIELLRAEVWQHGTKTKRFSYAADPEPPGVRSTHHWLQEIGDCPKGILEMVNSRACRSAIMFNDVLTVEECKALLARLTQCAFPFQCAHGRPSMVPLVSKPTFDKSSGDLIGRDACSVLDGTNARNAGDEEGFVQAFRLWQK